MMHPAAGYPLTEAETDDDRDRRLEDMERHLLEIDARLRAIERSTDIRGHGERGSR